MTKQYDNYADLITFTRASTGTALRRVGYLDKWDDGQHLRQGSHLRPRD
jgi:hypothetical protein